MGLKLMLKSMCAARRLWQICLPLFRNMKKCALKNIANLFCFLGLEKHLSWKYDLDQGQLQS